MTIQKKGTEQYFPVVLFIMLYKVVQTFESVDEIPGVKRDLLHESSWAVSSLSIPKRFSGHYSLLLLVVVLMLVALFSYDYKLNLRLFILFQDSKLLRAITKIVEDWIKTKVVNYLTL